MKKLGYNRKTKACRERYYHHITQSTSREFTNLELNKLLNNINIHGNKWNVISQVMGKRTGLDIKNKFYSIVRKIFRRLIKVSFKTKNSTQMTERLKPQFISSVFCESSSNEVKVLFKNLIITHKNLQITDSLDEKTIKDVKYIVNYLKEKQFINSQNWRSSSEVILKKIKNRQAVFTLPHYAIEKKYKSHPIPPDENQFTTQSIQRELEILSFASNYQSFVIASNLTNYFALSNQLQQNLDSFRNQIY